MKSSKNLEKKKKKIHRLLTTNVIRFPSFQNVFLCCLRKTPECLLTRKFTFRVRLIIPDRYAPTILLYSAAQATGTEGVLNSDLSLGTQKTGMSQLLVISWFIQRATDRLRKFAVRAIKSKKRYCRFVTYRAPVVLQFLLFVIMTRGDTKAQNN